MVVKAQKEVVKAESEYRVRTLDDEIRSIELQRVRDEANNWQLRCEQLSNELDALKTKTDENNQTVCLTKSKSSSKLFSYNYN
mmetsp:Transcript_33487/g.38451  ORF Transcript_33487/g.38451 Transcript_33487/m.38451 type:complete len:83 (+) Transcript_33487:3-251(+)